MRRPSRSSAAAAPLLALLCGVLLAGCVRAAGAEAEAASEQVVVTCGSTIKLESSNTRHHLHSHEVSYGYGRGSGQQSVTGFPERDSANSLWTVKGDDCPQGTPIKPGQEIRMQHIVTRRWLHSHLFASPLSNNQEVSCFGDDRQTDSGDVWRVEWDNASMAHWRRDAPVRLVHKDTGSYLSTHAIKYQRPIPGHTEVMAMKTKGVHAEWRATEGVYWEARKTE